MMLLLLIYIIISLIENDEEFFLPMERWVGCWTKLLPKSKSPNSRSSAEGFDFDRFPELSSIGSSELIKENLCT